MTAKARVAMAGKLGRFLVTAVAALAPGPPAAAQETAAQKALNAALLEAVAPGEDSIIPVILLLGAGADPNAKDDMGMTPLHMAGWFGSRGYSLFDEFRDGVFNCDSEIPERTELIRLLLRHGASVKARNEYGGTPLHSIAFTGPKNLPALLIAAGAEVDARDKYGATPLHRAAGAVDRACTVDELIDAAADPNAIDERGDTPLRYAAEGGNEHTALRLLARGGVLDP